MESIRCFAYVFILMTLKSQFIVGNAKDCDCKGTKKMVNRVRNLLLKDMFDMKLQNDMLSSKIDRLERMFQEQFPVSVSSSTQDTSQIERVDSKGPEIDTETEQANEVPEMDSRLGSLIKAFQSEKKQRLQIESVVRYELRTLNDSFNAFTTHMEAAFTKSVNSMTEKIKNFEQNVTDSLSDVKNDYKSSINDVQKLLSGVIATNITDLHYELDSINKNLSRFDMEVSSVIDTAILNKSDIQSQVKRVFRCKIFTEGTQCERFYCDDRCAENGGECTGPGACFCPDHRDGVNCEFVIKCENIKPFPGVSVSYFGDRNPGTVASYTCDDDQYKIYPSNVESSECTKDFKWHPEPPKCYSCPPYRFTCSSGACIGKERVCDGLHDCDDGSDELNCVCAPWKVACPSGTCIWTEWVCDGDEDCEDGSDEFKCDSTINNGEQRSSSFSLDCFLCPSGVCIPNVFVCNRVDDCEDGSDEFNCGCPLYTFTCSSGACIRKGWVCDGDDDCEDGSDELNCEDDTFDPIG